MYGIIYKATGPGGKVYIGQTTKTLKRRKGDHKVRAKKQDRRGAFQVAILEHGFDSFTWEQIDTADTKEELDQKEKSWIAQYNCIVPHGYNGNDGGTSYIPSAETRRKIGEAQRGEKGNNYGKHPSEETRRKMSEALRGRKMPPRPDEWRRKQSEAHTGKRHTEETRKKMSAAQKGKHGGPFTEEHRRKLGEAHKGKKFGPPSEETRRKISEALKGKLVSAETRERLRESHLGHRVSEETKEKLRAISTGRKLSPEAIKKMAEARRGKKIPREIVVKALRAKSQFSENDIKRIREMISEGIRGKEIAKMYGVSEQLICGIKKGRNYAWIT
jgi:group I intron endonuclease